MQCHRTAPGAFGRSRPEHFFLVRTVLHKGSAHSCIRDKRHRAVLTSRTRPGSESRVHLAKQRAAILSSQRPSRSRRMVNARSQPAGKSYSLQELSAERKAHDEDVRDESCQQQDEVNECGQDTCQAEDVHRQAVCLKECTVSLFCFNSLPHAWAGTPKFTPA
jgi:hypothetical protein